MRPIQYFYLIAITFVVGITDSYCQGWPIILTAKKHTYKADSLDKTISGMDACGPWKLTVDRISEQEKKFHFLNINGVIDKGSALFKKDTLVQLSIDLNIFFDYVFIDSCIKRQGELENSINVSSNVFRQDFYCSCTQTSFLDINEDSFCYRANFNEIRGEETNIGYNEFCKEVNFFGVKMHSVRFDANSFNKSLRIYGLDADSLCLGDNTCKGVITLGAIKRLKYLEIYSLDRSDVTNYDLSTFDQGTNPAECILNMHNLDLNRINFDYSNFKISFDSNISIRNRLSFYNRLLVNQSQRGYKNGYSKADIEYHDVKLKYEFTVQDWISKKWWNYGYNKEYIFKWTALAFLKFMFFNIVFLPYLLNKVYLLENIYDRFQIENRYGVSRIRKLYYRFWLGLLYSIMIFFGIRLEVSKVKFVNIAAAMYIYFFYLIGIACLVFIANYILLK